jgi:hypothetical protein
MDDPMREVWWGSWQRGKNGFGNGVEWTRVENWELIDS